MTAITIDVPTDFTAFELAEWVEVQMLVTRAEALSRSAILRHFASGQSPDGAELDELFSEVRRRAELAPNIYPYRAADDSITVDRTVDGRIYHFLLILSLRNAPFRLEAAYNDINPTLELLTREALLAYTGGLGQGRRFGWPNGDGRPQHLADAVEWLACEMGLSVGVVRDQVDDTDKDGGIDVVVWQPFADGAPSFNVWMAQCTVQADYQRKKGDIEVNKWIAWIGFGSTPAKVLSIPYAIPLDAKVRTDLLYSFTVLLDRLRICALLDRVTNLAEFDEYQALALWVESELDRIRVALVTAQQKKPRLSKRRRPLRTRRPAEPTTN